MRSRKFATEALRKFSAEESTEIIGGATVNPGAKANIALSVADLFTSSPFRIPVHLICSLKPGNEILDAALAHEDEMNGV